MTSFQIALLAGAFTGLGLALLAWRFAPAHPDLGDALTRLGTGATFTTPRAEVQAGAAKDRVGLWVMRHLPDFGWRVPVKELALLRMPTHRFYGEKALFFVVGLVFPPILTALALLFGISVPFVLPLVGSLVLALGLSFLPDYNVRSDAAEARQEFTRSLSAYLDLVALERNAGSGVRQALESAAQVGDSWVFRRLAEELARSRWSGITPWDSLAELSDQLGLPELKDLADIMRLSGEEGTAVYETLRARASSMRTALLNQELSKANAIAERMSMPVSALALVFITILAVPGLLRVFA